jgi:hypothetical protein
MPKSKAMGLSSPAKRRKATMMVAKRAMEKELEEKRRAQKRDWKSDERQRKKQEAEAKRVAEEGRKAMEKEMEKAREDIDKEQKRQAAEAKRVAEEGRKAMQKENATEEGEQARMAGTLMLKMKRAEVKVRRAKRPLARTLRREFFEELEPWEGRNEGCEAGALSRRVSWETSESE